MRVQALAALAFASCVIGDDPETASPGSTGIVNPTDGDDHTNINVGLLRIGGSAHCSATLVHPRMIVTAAHCIPTDTFESEGFSTAVLGAAKHPAWIENAGPNDIAVALLADPAPMPPAAYDTKRAVPGQLALAVGFGITAEGGTDAGVRRSGGMTVDTVDDWIATRPSPSSTCHGDSGGALFESGRIVGVASGTEYCNGGRGFFARIDRHYRFITNYLTGYALVGGTAPYPCGWLDAGNVLLPGEQRWSCNGRYMFTHQTDGNVVLYRVDDTGYLEPRWATNTYGQATTALVMQADDGNLVLYGPNGPIWASNTTFNPRAVFEIADNGNLAVWSFYTKLWETGTGE